MCYQEKQSFESNKEAEFMVTQSIKIAKSGKSFWYHIWSDCDKPRDGHVYRCYKLSKSKYRQACRLASNTRVSKLHTTLNMLYRTKNSKQLWKVVGNTRKDLNDCSKTLSINVLEQYFEQKFFGSSRVITDEMVQAQDRIDAKLKQQSINTEQVTSNRVRRLIKQLKLNASPAQDGTTAEHLICFGQSNYQSLVLHADLVHTIWCGA